MVKYEGGCVPEGDLAGFVGAGELNGRKYTICGSQEKVF